MSAAPAPGPQAQPEIATAAASLVGTGQLAISIKAHRNWPNEWALSAAWPAITGVDSAIVTATPASTASASNSRRPVRRPTANCTRPAANAAATAKAPEARQKKPMTIVTMANHQRSEKAAAGMMAMRPAMPNSSTKYQAD